MKFTKPERLYQLHWLLIPIFFIIHNYIDFYGLVDFSQLQSSLIQWFLFPIFVLGIGYFIYKKFSSASLFTFYITAVFFLAGSVMKELKAITFLQFLSKYSVFLPLVIIGFFILAIRLYKFPEKNGRAHSFLFLLFTVLILFEIGRYFIVGTTGLEKRNALVIKNEAALKTIPTTAKPSIYFLLFDEHPSTLSLQTLFNYSNQSLDSNLQQLGFKVSAYAESAYPYTAPSLYSLFGLNEFSPSHSKEFKFKDLSAAEISFTKNRLVPFLKQHGYSFVNAGIFDVVNFPSLLKNELNREPAASMIRKQTLLNRIKEDLGWNYSHLYQKQFINQLNHRIRSEANAAKKVETLLDSCLHLSSTTPVFFYGHFMLPHNPYKFDSAGQLQTYTNDRYKAYYQKPGTYLNQVAYTRNLILQLAKEIIDKKGSDAIVIIQGDHGYRMFNSKRFNVANKRKILSAIYFPDKDYSLISDSLYAPNTFRIILNKYFEQEISFLQSK